MHTMADVWDAYRSELDGVEDRIHQNLTSSVTLVNTVAAHILNSGGKRIRPLLLLLCARLCGYAGREPSTRQPRGVHPYGDPAA
jgi:octaprenyl-diphosphate synthase